MKLNISEINSFFAEIQRSILAVKVIKRIMYGKCSFETLKTKVILTEE
ncbi:hypothetical protein K0040_15550 [Terrisporobacter petrolearius]|nr:hypothetical protein [Terrisporobacter petrolearius]MCC3865678.1 hypothetical protein [Terrisporobacter petrolearius]